MPDESELSRFVTLYEQLRLKLLDLSKRNRMLNYSFAARSKKHVQIVDDVFEDVYRKLVAEEVSLEIRALPEPGNVPADERNEDFKSALEHARVSDVEHVVRREAIESEGREDGTAVATLERELREKVRAELGMPPRPARMEIDRAEHARSHGIDPILALPPYRPKDARTDLALQTLKYPDELESILEKISDDARLAEQEMGVSTLFLAFGFLEWYEADHSDKICFAPLLLLPVRLEEKKVRGKSIYYLSTREGSAEANLSLQKLVEKDFNRALPEFDCGDEDPSGSIESYLEKIHDAIEGLKRWGIRRWLVLGHFAFGRFAMYADLNPGNWSEHPSAHNLVRAILSGVERTADGPGGLGVPDDYPIDNPEFEKIAPILIHDADASQHSALIDVMKEKNLVIQGPPGTGKSQTITNIIANALAAGKRVLFVAEKQAALDVVKRRLDQASLGNFCLELHSDKASPKTVIESLRTRVGLGFGCAPSGVGTAKDPILVESRDEINRYLAALHAEDSDGSTPFDLIWKAVRGRTLDSDVIDSIRHVAVSSEVLADPNRLAELRGQIEFYAHLSASFTGSFGHPAHSPWACVQLGELPPYEIPRLIETLRKLRDAATGLASYFDRHEGHGAGSLADIDRLGAFDGQITDPPGDRTIADIANLDLDGFERGLALHRDILKIEAKLRLDHARWVTLVSADKGWREKLQAYGARAWPPADEINAAAKHLQKKRIGKWIAALTPTGKAARLLLTQLGLQGTGSAVHDLATLTRHVRELAAFEKDSASISERLARRKDLANRISVFPGNGVIESLVQTLADADAVSAAIAWIREIRQSGGPDFWKDRLISANASEERDALRTAAREGALLKSRYEEALTIVTGDFGMRDFEPLSPTALPKRCDLLIARQPEINEMLALRRQREVLAQAGLSDFLASADKLLLEAGRLQRVFETFVSERRADRMRRTTPALSANGTTLEARRKLFAERDRRKIDVDRNAVKDKLLRVTPAPGFNNGPKNTWTDTAMLRNEFAKQWRFTPVRNLLSRAGQAIQTLTPCFMMSPLSLAKFLTPGKLAFDLIVIDEASQMQPEDALGGLLRAKQIVVVGDPKQLPPTDFFARSDEKQSSDDEFEDIDDESILEACQRSFRELRCLKWHYRSRCESLIAFSNAEFYKNALITFPQARPASFSVDLVRVDGFYQARRNVIEAGLLAQEAVEFMRHFAEESEAVIPTLGIVAVNSPQCELLREELRRISADDALIDRYREKVESKGEGVFIKNLENVQGDERDFIFISLTYGREPGAAAMKQRFGPINGKQGHRRLNVLFSRARIRMCIFASFGSADVKPAEGSHQGVQVLKRYLEYAETRGRAAVQTSGGEPDSDFEIEVADRLRRSGYDVVYQVGVSGYKIDLGVRHPDHPEMFLVGVECDGARYHSSTSARDRDRLREEVLGGLGWDLVRVWSTDWFDNPALETEKLIKKLERRRSQPVRGFNDYRW